MAETKARKIFGIEIMNEALTVEHFISMIYGARLSSVSIFWISTYIVQSLFFLIQFYFSEFMHVRLLLLVS
jgi:hypothetical protein